MKSGGAERVIQLLANHFAHSGWKIEIILLLSNEVDYQQFPLDKSITIVDLSEKNVSYSKNAIKWLKSIRKYVKAKKPDCIVSFVGRINALVLSATIGLGIPTVVSERSDPMQDGRGYYMRKYCDVLYHRASAIVFQTKYQQSCFSSSLGKKSYIVPNPVSVSIIDNIVANPLEISTAGRLFASKNHVLLIDAIKLVTEKYPEVQCFIYGEGDQRNNLEQRIKHQDLSGNVHLAGNKTDIYRWISRSSIFVMTSEYEGMPNALVEAMMLGKACISTDYPGVNEVIENGVNGIIIPRGDCKQLAHAIVQLLDNEEYKKRLSNNAKKTAALYKTDRIVEEWKRLIDNISIDNSQKKYEGAYHESV